MAQWPPLRTLVRLDNSIISNFMNYQDRLQTNLLLLFVHT